MNLIKEIIIHYWMGDSEKMAEEIGLKHKDRFTYSKNKRDTIVDSIIEAGYNAMLYKPKPDTMIIFIDDRRFQQR